MLATMKTINFKKEIMCSVEDAIQRAAEALKAEGFGFLTRIDLHTKIKDALNKEILPTVILGACKPSVAYEAFQKNTDVASLLPCNVVIRDLGQGKVSVEFAKATTVLEVLGDPELLSMAKAIDAELERALRAV